MTDFRSKPRLLGSSKRRPTGAYSHDVMNDFDFKSLLIKTEYFLGVQELDMNLISKFVDSAPSSHFSANPR